MTQIAACLGMAALGPAVALALTLLQNRYVPGDPMDGARVFWLWLAAALWIVAWSAVAFDRRSRRR